MNKYKRALNKIGDTLTYYMVRKDLNPLPSYNEIYDSMDTLRELVEKEKPKKPIDIEFGPCGDLMLCCPTCKHGVVPIPTYHGNKQYPRCPFCGQKLMEEDKDDC
jgi:hypothetical protein